MANEASDAEFREGSAQFLSWLPQTGVELSHKIALVDHRAELAGRAVIATEDIAEDEDLFAIPRSSILTPQTSSLPDDVSAELDDPWLSLILTLVYEHQQGTLSPWKPYLDVLPSTFDTLMFWSEAQLEHLQGSAVLRKIGRTEADQTFTKLVIPVIRRYNEAFRTQSLLDEELINICHRMGSTIMAYAFDLEKPGKDGNSSTQAEDGWEEDSEDGAILPVGMVPMADMLNADADRNNAKLFYEEEKVVMKSIKSIPAGQEIFNDYGLIPSADLLRRYGYVTSNYAKYDVVEVEQSLVRSVTKELLKTSEDDMQRRLTYLEGEISVDAFEIARRSAEDGQFSIELIAVLRCFAMTQADFDKLSSKGKIPDKPLEQDEHTVLELLRAVLVQRRSAYTPAEPLSRPETLSLSNAGPTAQDRRQYMAEWIVNGEKIVLREAIDTVLGMLETTSKKRKTTSFEAHAHQKKQKH